ncbi:Transmembrane osmosensor [Marasmius tenuissimus]|uniref:Transmembrane osmosensor n=1 Tax=Marasmius tenuissimus TaxID=585030 RepID=A0ABR2ZME8_9AGAR
MPEAQFGSIPPFLPKAKPNKNGDRWQARKGGRVVEIVPSNVPLLSQNQSDDIPSPTTQSNGNPASVATVPVIFKAETLHSCMLFLVVPRKMNDEVDLRFTDTAGDPTSGLSFAQDHGGELEHQMEQLEASVSSDMIRVLGDVPVGHAITLHEYSTSPRNSNGFLFFVQKDEILDILYKNGDWWRVRKGNGTVGIVPSNLLVLSSEIQFDGISRTAPPEGSHAPVVPPATVPVIFKAKVLRFNYTAEDSSNLSLAEGMILDVLNMESSWWKARAPDGTVGVVPSTFLRVVKGFSVDYMNALYDSLLEKPSGKLV